ncbi:hypothetical protein ACQ4PT_005159 [Festuca glaucescens]
MADWSTLPSELVRHIADCLLSTNDLDCYMHFRAVCPSWRSATDDPTNSSDLRFRPLRWIIIDEVFESDDRLLVNTATGRVVRKYLPLLRRFYVVATTHRQFKIFNITTYGDEPEPVKSIGDHAIFVGNRRCVSVTAEKFPSVVSNYIH